VEPVHRYDDGGRAERRDDLVGERRLPGAGRAGQAEQPTAVPGEQVACRRDGVDPAQRR
jgi:hypothetical protein